MTTHYLMGIYETSINVSYCVNIVVSTNAKLFEVQPFDVCFQACIFLNIFKSLALFFLISVKIYTIAKV